MSAQAKRRAARNARVEAAEIGLETWSVLDEGPDDRPKVRMSIQSRSWVTVRNVLVTEREGSGLGRDRGTAMDVRWSNK